MQEQMLWFIDGELTLGNFVANALDGWNEVTEQRGKLDQLEIYRSTLGLDALSNVVLCRLHSDLMFEKDPALCGFGSEGSDSSDMTVVLVSILVPVFLVMILVQIFFNVKRQRSENKKNFPTKNVRIFM